MRHTLLFIVLFQVVNYTFAQVKRYHPLRINNNITLDGKLSEQEWQQAEMESDFMQYDPSGGAEPSERTEIKILVPVWHERNFPGSRLSFTGFA